MARTRMIRPEFWDDEKLAKVSRDSRLLFAGLWTHADDYGTCRANPIFLRSKIFPYDQDILADVFEKWLKDLEKFGFIIPFNQDGENFFFIKNFQKYQTIDHPGKFRYAKPPRDILAKVSRRSREPVRKLAPQSESEIESKSETESKNKGRIESDPLFEQFWKGYPKKVAKEVAREKFMILVRAGKVPELIKATNGYLDFLKHKRIHENFAQEPMNPATFLMKERWRDYIDFAYKPPM